MKLKLFICSVFFLISVSLFSFEPVLNRISPLGGKIGTEVKVNIYGARLIDFTGLLFNTKKVRVIKVIKVAANKVELLLKIDADCKPGLIGYRVVTKTGLSLLKLFSVNNYPVIQSAEPNNSFKTAQLIKQTSTIEGVVTSEDIDFYAIEAEVSQRISVEVEGLRLGYTFFDPLITVYDPQKKIVKVVDDTLLLKQDPCYSFFAKSKGIYYISIREAAFRGNKNSRYRLYIGDFPRPLLAFPIGLSSVEKSGARYLENYPLKKAREITFDKVPEGLFEYFDADEKGLSPSPIYFHAHGSKAYLEKEPNPNSNKSNKISFPLPFSIEGIIEKKADEDWFAFTAKKGENFDLFVHARKYRSPLDPTVSLFDKNKKHIGSNDDSGSPDSFLKFSATYNGLYYLRIRDSLMRGGVDFVYHVEFKKRSPQLSTYLPATKVRTQEGQMVDLSVGNKAVLKMNLNRQYTSDELKVTVTGLPKGVTCQVANISSKVKSYPIVLVSKGDVPLQSGHLKIKLTSIKNNKIIGDTKQSVHLVYGFPNNTVYHSAVSKKIPFSISQKAPYSIQILKPPHPLAQTGTLRLTIKIKREKDCKGEIRIQTVAEIPGVGISKEIIIKKDQDTGSIILSANSNASVGRWSIAVRGVWNAGRNKKKRKLGNKIVGSNLMFVDVVPMHINATLGMAVVPQGGKISMLCKLDHLKPFVGKASLELSGLPNAAISKKVAFTSKDKEIWIEVQTDKKTRRGRHRSVFCYVKIPYKNGFINQSIGKGTLRVDRPKPKKDPLKQKKKKLSRLEASRQEKINK